MLGSLVCLDALLDTFSILPLRILYAAVVPSKDHRTAWWEETQKLLLIVLVVLAISAVDASQLYHSIRGQSTLKLYVLFNVFEVMDKLLSSFGLDILDSESLATPLQLLLEAAYASLHALMLLYQVVTLNVAVNSHSNAVLTLLVSNQFMELKSAVFKRFDRENLYQLACADVVERVQLAVYLFIVAWRNGSELFTSLPSLSTAVFTSTAFWERLTYPLLLVYGSEIAVDALKHAFICKFNNVAPLAYHHFRTALVADMASAGSNFGSSALLARKIGFSVLPLACLVIKVILPACVSLYRSWGAAGTLPVLAAVWLAVVVVRCFVGLALIRLSARYRHDKPQAANRSRRGSHEDEGRKLIG
jgi:hypothetical protein